MPDPIAAKGLQGMQNLAGELSKAADAGKKGTPGKFEQVRMEKLEPQDKMQQIDKQLDQLQKTGQIDKTGAPKEVTMAQRVAAQSGIAYHPGLDKVNQMQGVDSTQSVWKPQAPAATTASPTGNVAQGIKDFNDGQQRLVGIMQELRSGKPHSREELLQMQLEVSSLSEQMQMTSKLVDSAMQSIKQVMQQQV